MVVSQRIIQRHRAFGDEGPQQQGWTAIPGREIDDLVHRPDVFTYPRLMPNRLNTGLYRTSCSLSPTTSRSLFIARVSI